MLLFTIVLVAVGILALFLYVQHKAKQKREADAAHYGGPVDPFADTDENALRGDPRRLTAGDIVDAYGKSLVVRGSLRLSEGDYTWDEHFLDTGAEVRRWLSVEVDPDIEMVLWEEIKGHDLTPGATTIEHDGVTYRSVESGTAKYRGEATTGLPATGTVDYHDYTAENGEKLAFERFGAAGKWEASTGLRLDRNQVVIYHQSGSS
ncbi:DUF4178 domain-containing protein [Natronoglycomyces albus]|uniref:DUF4178 domain-containing protein n=1 Tax=Natronoglycomyces albus TaxID=2811108 RepID=A0A895XT39_9ACTN|nr:DUF4178 domain-containing protein [Natronoglycomyces albus]QSB06479.1 DUF4178 domain-containing protein [Natronoglycomyces albus]